MKAGVLAVAAAIAGGVNARDLGRRHGHQDFHERGLLATPSESCGCTTVWSTVTGEPQLYFPPAPTAASVASGSGAPPAPSAPAGSDACSNACNTEYNNCRSAPDANRSTCASNYASCLGYSPFDGNGSLVMATACSSVASTPAASAPGSSAPAPSAPAGSDVCSNACNTEYNTCRSAPDANRSTCASKYASCLGYSPFDGNGSLVMATACSIASTPAASAPGSSAPAPSAPAPSAPAGSDACSNACNTEYNTCRSAPDANRSTCASKYASCLGYSPFDSNGSLVMATACSIASTPAASAPGSSAPAPSAPAASAPASSAPATSKGVSTAPTAPASTAPAVVPTPLATTCPTPGVYTIPATTVTLTESTTVCGATSTGLPSAGTYTVGGVTTVVTTATTVVCPYAAVSTSEGVVTSTILTTTYVCPSAGTYTINPLTTTVTEPAVWVYPTPASYAPGTYTQPEVVTTITETNVVVFCPYSSSYSTIVDATLPAGTPAQATSAPAPVTTSVVVPVATPSSSSVYVAPSSSAVSVVPSSSVVASSVASPSASSTSSSSGNGGSVGSTGKQWAMTYSPYQDSGSCKTAAEVSVDVALIASKGFTAIRIYSTDCSGLENVGNAAKLAGIKMIVGIFISETGCSGAADQVTELIAWGQWSLVELIVVGNEAIFGGHTTASELAGFISSSRASFASAGYTGQITTTEPLNIWQENTSVLCSAVDITGANLHPFFNAEVTAENAGKFALSQLELADAICPGLTAINLECGWPSAGTCNGAACPGVEEQKTAVSSIIESCGGRAAIFSYTNDLWKQPGGFGCEQSWGSIHLF
ncbi:uncharacterized protein EAF02_000175 [Botrytis sinoallii]|uniref:uncharacterized protein n=1 Tax=Botrytis sinoallii TaxID=1463999 RepID=UPI00190216BB|nr:uncharacterized protein EAF02_000175 [Botrytis sinoallii]KAF7892637.1 hypothetical protein EAF02_000175 [Botrytis sinoallii]